MHKMVMYTFMFIHVHVSYKRMPYVTYFYLYKI